MSDIIARMDAAFERAQWRYPESPPKWFYLSEPDWAEFNADRSELWGSEVRCFSYRDVLIRPGKRSRMVTKNGCLIAVPQRLSPRVKAAA